MENWKALISARFWSFPLPARFGTDPLLRSRRTRVCSFAALRKEALKRRRDDCARFSQDGRYLAVYPEREGNMYFHADGGAACHEDMMEFLRNREI